MRIRFSKGAGKRDTLCAIRDDGSSSWAALPPGFVTHDFMHYAVETALGYREAFYGLLTRGYDIQDFGETDERTGQKPSLPVEASHAECAVQVLWQQWLGGDWPSPDALSEMLALVWDQFQLPPPPTITPEQLSRIRRIYEDLLQQWARTDSGASFERDFPQ